MLPTPASANIATITQNELTNPAMVKAAAPITSPQINNTRAPSQSTRNPAGVCNAADTMLKAASAMPISV